MTFKKVGGIRFWSVGIFGGSFYIKRRKSRLPSAMPAVITFFAGFGAVAIAFGGLL